MKYYSTNNPYHLASLSEAVIKGLAPDNGLYMPQQIPFLPKELIDKMPEMTFREIGYEVIGALFAEDLSKQQIKELVDHTLSFDAPLIQVEEDVFSLELFHGPTLAFKDFGARFCSKLMSMLVKEKSRTLRVLVATSGDTGSAVANGFLGVEGVEVIILFPKGKVSKLQEKQFTTLGQNITSLEVDGVFDDCQTLVKQAFLDQKLNQHLLLTSANSINIARWVPQCLYYFYAYSRIPKGSKKVVFSVPSGNFGNLGAGILASRMGLPIDHFVAATNVNKVVPNYLQGLPFHAQPSIATVSNSMDVGNPSNFPRLQALYEKNEEQFREKVKGYYYSDRQTIEAIQAIQLKSYTLDPHGAVGYLGLKDFMAEHPDYIGVFLETAHPGKFRDVVEDALGKKLVLPERLAAFLDGEKKVIQMGKNFAEFKGFLEGLD
ncbi:MAG: threonine synthase [Bacteroidota bacterium]